MLKQISKKAGPDSLVTVGQEELSKELRRSKWLKMDGVEKWTTLRDAQKQVPKLMQFAADWKKSPRCPKEGPLFSATTAANLAVCTASWLRSTQDTYDIYARRKEPYAEMVRKGFRLHAHTYPSRHVERLADPYASGYVTIFDNDEARRFAEDTSGVCHLRVEMPGVPITGDLSVGDGDQNRAIPTEFTDRQCFMGIMKTIAVVTSALYIHQRTVTFQSSSPLLQEVVRLLYPHLVENQFMVVSDPVLIEGGSADSTLRLEGDEVKKLEAGEEEDNDDEADGTEGEEPLMAVPVSNATTTPPKAPSKASSMSTGRPRLQRRAGGPRKGDVAKATSTGTALMKTPISALANATSKKSARHVSVRYNDYDFHNTWMVVPSAGEVPSTTPKGSSSYTSYAGKEWTSSKVKSFAKYLAEHDAEIVFVDRKWPPRQQLEAEVLAARTVNGKLYGTKCTIVEIDDLVDNFHLLVKTHMLSIFIPPSMDKNVALYKKLHIELQSTMVIGINANALDVFAMYPHLKFNDVIGNNHRYMGVERSVLRRHFNCTGNFVGMGSGIPIAERYEVTQAVDKVPSNIVLQERFVAFYQQPYLVTAFPMMSARWFGL